MGYFNYHAKAKRLIEEGHLINYEIVERWNNISPALVLYFDNNRPMPIRDYRWDEYRRCLLQHTGSIKERIILECGIII